MAIQLTLQSSPPVPIEVGGVLPETLLGREPHEWSEWPIRVGNRLARLADYFQIECDADDESLTWRGALQHVHQIGAGMSRGALLIEGTAGDHVGARMCGGRLTVRGDVGDWAGAEMSGGRLDIHGHAGDLVGAAYRGSRRGMKGGTLLVHGNAGIEVGQAMRRGLIAIGGDCGDLAGFNLLAGTIVVGGRCGPRLGLGMKRGSIIVLGEVVQPGTTFVTAGCQEPLVWRLLHAELRRLGFPCSPAPTTGLFEVHHGDLAAGGRGECWHATAKI